MTGPDAQTGSSYPTPKACSGISNSKPGVLLRAAAAAAAAAMACSAHLLSQSLYSSHHASPAARGNLRTGARPPARASPAARPGSSVRGCRGVSLRVAASFEQGRRQVEVRALLNSQLCAGTARFGKGCSDCGRKLGRTVGFAALFVRFGSPACAERGTGGRVFVSPLILSIPPSCLSHR